MKHALTYLMVLLTIVSIVIGCTANERAKNLGGTMTIDLPPGKRLIVATWKNDELWYLTKDNVEATPPTRYTFEEKSSYGILEGKVIFIEH